LDLAEAIYKKKLLIPHRRGRPGGRRFVHLHEQEDIAQASVACDTSRSPALDSSLADSDMEDEDVANFIVSDLFGCMAESFSEQGEDWDVLSSCTCDWEGCGDPGIVEQPGVPSARSPWSRSVLAKGMQTTPQASNHRFVLPPLQQRPEPSPAAATPMPKYNFAAVYGRRAKLYPRKLPKLKSMDRQVQVRTH